MLIGVENSRQSPQHYDLVNQRFNLLQGCPTLTTLRPVDSSSLNSRVSHEFWELKSTGFIVAKVEHLALQYNAYQNKYTVFYFGICLIQSIKKYLKIERTASEQRERVLPSNKSIFFPNSQYL